MTATWEGPLGAVTPVLRPSWLEAVPRITARMRSPSARASERRFNTTMPHPSLRTKPSADASKDLHRPSGDNMCAFDKKIVVSGMRIRLTPPAKAMRHSPALKLWQAKCTATRDAEQPVSTDIDGPCNPRMYDIRPEAMLCALPVPTYASMELRPPSNCIR